MLQLEKKDKGLDERVRWLVTGVDRSGPKKTTEKSVGLFQNFILYEVYCPAIYINTSIKQYISSSLTVFLLESTV